MEGGSKRLGGLGLGGDTGVGLVGGELGARDGLLVIGCLLGVSVTGFKEGLEDGTCVGDELG